MSETYGGYANRETYDAVLWLTNDQSTYVQCREASLEAYASAYADPDDTLTGPDLYRYAVRQAGDAIRALVDDWTDSVVEGFADRDTRMAILDVGSLWRVDWEAVATAILPEHNAYPHEPGYLHDCYGCEESCHCRPGFAECVYGGPHNGNAETLDPGALNNPPDPVEDRRWGTVCVCDAYAPDRRPGRCPVHRDAP